MGDQQGSGTRGSGGLAGAIAASGLLATHALLVARGSPPPLLDALCRYAPRPFPVPRQLPVLLAIVGLTALVMAAFGGAPPPRRRWVGGGTLALVAVGTLGLLPAGALSMSSRAFELVLVVASLALLAARAWRSRAAGPRSVRGALARWTALYVSLGLLAALYLGYPPLRLPVYLEARAALVLALVLGVAIGLPAALLAGAPRGSGARDLGLGMIVFWRALGAALRGKGWRLRRALARRWVHAALLQYLLLGGIITPLALRALSAEHAQVVARMMHPTLASWSVGQGLALHGLRLIEVSIASSALLFGAFLLTSRPRSMDRTAGGWIVTLLFFYPFEFGTTALLPVPATDGVDVFRMRVTSLAQDIVSGLVLAAALVIAVATVALGPRFAYGSHRGLVKRGPYAIVRHPAYASEYLLRWFQLGPAVANAWQVVGLLGLGVLYHLRAVTEERHLRQDPEYEAYARAVRYRYIPHVW